MPSLKVKDLAEIMVEELAPTFSYKPENVEIKNICKRPGEKIYEYLMTVYEAEYTYESKDMFMGSGAKNLTLLQNHYKPSQLGNLINLIMGEISHKGKNYSIKLRKYYLHQNPGSARWIPEVYY